MIARPYEPPPDYPMVEDRWAKSKSRNYSGSSIEIPIEYRHIISAVSPAASYRSHSIDTAATATINRKLYNQQQQQRVHSPRLDLYCQQYPHHPHPQQQHPDMLRTRHVPEIAGIYQTEEQPCLRRFTRYNQSIKVAQMPSREEVMKSPQQQQQPSHKSIFTKSTSKKPLFFMGNWTFRDKNKTRPNISDSSLRSAERPQSMIFSNLPESFRRSKSGDAISQNRTSIIIGNTGGGKDAIIPRHTETRVPIRIERTVKSRTSSIQSPSPSTISSDFKTNVIVEDTNDNEPVAILRPKKENTIDSLNNNNNRYSFQSCVQLRKSCPDLDSAASTLRSNIRISKKRKTRRAHEKAQQAAWKKKHVKDWTLDDVLLWLQSNQMDEIASLLIGYDLRGEDLLEWNETTLEQLGVGDGEMRKTLLEQLEKIIKDGPEVTIVKENTGRTLFDLVKQTSYDQVLAVETPLTTRDITVTHGRLGCLQITKVNGANLPLREHDCLLEINERSGEQFKSALMLTKLISDSSGVPIRFVVLRRKTDNLTEEGENGRGTETSSGISSSPPTPNE